MRSTSTSADWLRFADEALAKPPAKPHIERHEGRGELVARWTLPLSLCPTTNRTRGAAGWALSRTKEMAYAIMSVQHRSRAEPLPGRPHVRCIRFSSSEPDTYNDGFKIAVDKLCAPTERAPKRLGYIRDDSPSVARITQHWEPAPPKRGFGLIEVWTGDEL